MKPLHFLLIATVMCCLSGCFLNSCTDDFERPDDSGFPNDPTDFQSGWKLIDSTFNVDAVQFFSTPNEKLGITDSNNVIYVWSGSKWLKDNSFEGPVASNSVGELYAINISHGSGIGPYPTGKGVYVATPEYNEIHSLAIDSAGNIFISVLYYDPAWFYQTLEYVYFYKKGNDRYTSMDCIYSMRLPWLYETTSKLYTDRKQQVYLAIEDTIIKLTNSDRKPFEEVEQLSFTKMQSISWDSANTPYLIGQTKADSLSRIYKWDVPSNSWVKFPFDTNLTYHNMAFDSNDRLYAAVTDRTTNRSDIMRYSNGSWQKLGKLNIYGYIESLYLDKSDHVYVSGGLYLTENSSARYRYFIATYEE